MVKEEICFETPILFCNVSIDIGIVALEVAVENANPITGENFLINFIGFNFVKANKNS